MIPFAVITLGCLIICTSSTLIVPPIADEKLTPNLTSYIFLGQDVLDPVPYIVSIQYRAKHRVWRHLCGGSIISSNYILTAAHCLVPHFQGEDLTRSFRILAGRNNLKSRIGSRHRIVSYTSHPQYDNEFSGFDIGVIKVHPRFKFNQKTIRKIGFESSERVMSDIPVVFHGWGFTHFGYPERLQKANFTILSQDKCIFEGHDVIAPTNLCIISKDLSVPYVGDSGGPLVNAKQTLQIGICSYGIWDIYYNYNYPTVFTRVSEFSNWIKEEIRN